tara:strand:- start:1500 stop:3350 length:1851 start_codon:yes stop_codon:yes gene_type:complete
MALLQISEPGKTQAPHEKKFFIGIDLGTTNSLVAVIQNGSPTVLTDKNNEELFPSVVQYKEDGTVIVCNESNHDDLITFRSIKRLIGKNVKDLQENKTYLPCKFIPNENIIKLEVFDKILTPIEISSEILKHLKNFSEEKLNGEIMGCVITVPAYFDDAQRQATKDAANLSGLKVLRLLNEPTAAAIAYGLQSKKVSKVLVYDLGGGTFDVSVLDLNDGVFKVLATGGNSSLGGDDFDNLIVKYIIEKFNLNIDVEVRNKLYLYSKEIKYHLSDNDEFAIDLKRFGLKDKKFIIKREEFNQIIEHLVQNTLKISKKVLSDSKLSIEDVDEIILVGGSTRVPFVKESVENFFNKQTLSNINPDNVVAIGASIQASILAGDFDKDLLLLDVIPLSLGIETMGEIVEIIIPRNSTIPISSSKEYTTFKDGQTSMSIHVVQGERDIVSDCRSLAKFVVKDIPPMLAGSARVKLEFQIDADGILNVSATETTTGKTTSVEVKPSYGLSDSQIEEMLKASFENAKEDINKRQLRESIVEAERVILSIDSALKIDGKELLDSQEFDEICKARDELKLKIQQSEKDLIISAVKNLEKVSEIYVSRRMNSNIQKIMKGTDIEEFK